MNKGEWTDMIGPAGPTGEEIMLWWPDEGEYISFYPLCGVYDPDTHELIYSPGLSLEQLHHFERGDPEPDAVPGHGVVRIHRKKKSV